MGKILKNGTEYGLGGNELIDRIYPVGSIYISTSASFNPQTTWGGTWVKTAKGRCLIGANDTYPLGSTGGEERHYLTVAEMPSHTHNTKDWILGGGGSNANITMGGNSYAHWFGNELISNAGEGKAHNNMQPYLAVYIWERIA